MKQKKEINLPELANHLAIWMMAKHAHHHGLKRIPKKVKNAFYEKANAHLQTANKNKSLRVLNKKGVPIAVVTRTLSTMPRVKNQQGLAILYDEKFYKAAQPWIRKNLIEIASSAPRFTQIYLSPEDDASFGTCLKRAAFNTRYEILMGETRVALSNLMDQKTPPPNLNHLDLNLIQITTPAQIREAMKLQKKVALQSRRHTYFAHTPGAATP